VHNLRNCQHTTLLKLRERFVGLYRLKSFAGRGVHVVRGPSDASCERSQLAPLLRLDRQYRGWRPTRGLRASATCARRCGSSG